MRAFGYLTAAALLVGTLSVGGSQSATAATTNVPGPRFDVSTTQLADSASISVDKSTYSRIWSRGDCQALERVSLPVITEGGTAATRAAFNDKLRKAIDGYIAPVMDRGLRQQEEAAAYGGTCGDPEALDAYYGKVRLAGSIYRDRYVSVVLHRYQNFNSASSCLDSYRTYTFDLKTGKWAKLSKFAQSNHGQLAATWLSSALKTRFPEATHFNPLKNWTVSDSGVKFYAASGDLGSCSMGPKAVTVAWRNVLRPGDSDASAKVYRGVSSGPKRNDPVSMSTVVVKGRQFKAKVCGEHGCSYYYGVRNGRTVSKVWLQGKVDAATVWYPGATYFKSAADGARPVFVVDA